MSASNFELLRHVLQETDFILKHAAFLSEDDFYKDEVLQRAFVRSLEIMGEAAKRIDPDFKLQHPEMEWSKIAGTRDVMIHDYTGVDYEIVWNIITEKLPALKE
jgi:uncharacterized protein with HEPN domain